MVPLEGYPPLLLCPLQRPRYPFSAGSEVPLGGSPVAFPLRPVEYRPHFQAISAERAEGSLRLRLLSPFPPPSVSMALFLPWSLWPAVAPSLVPQQAVPHGELGAVFCCQMTFGFSHLAESFVNSFLGDHTFSVREYSGSVGYGS